MPYCSLPLLGLRWSVCLFAPGGHPDVLFFLEATKTNRGWRSFNFFSRFTGICTWDIIGVRRLRETTRARRTVDRQTDRRTCAVSLSSARSLPPSSLPRCRPPPVPDYCACSRLMKIPRCVTTPSVTLPVMPYIDSDARCVGGDGAGGTHRRRGGSQQHLPEARIPGVLVKSAAATRHLFPEQVKLLLEAYIRSSVLDEGGGRVGVRERRTHVFLALAMG